MVVGRESQDIRAKVFSAFHHTQSSAFMDQRGVFPFATRILRERLDSVICRAIARG